MAKANRDIALKTLGHELRTLRKDARLTQADLSARAGISRDTLSRVENGDSADTAIVQRIAAVLGHHLTIERKPLRAGDMRRRYAHLHTDAEE